MDANLGCHCPVMHLRAGLSLVVLGQFQEHIKLIRNSDDIRRFWNLEGPSCGLTQPVFGTQYILIRSIRPLHMFYQCKYLNHKGHQESIMDGLQ